MPKVTTSTGTILDPDNSMAKVSTMYAANKGLVGILVVHAKHSDGVEEYAILEGNKVIAAKTSSEDIGAYIDIMAIKKAYKI